MGAGEATDLIGNAKVAADLAAAGFSVFPCHAGGEQVKRPMPGVFWRSASTTDHVKISGWWKRWPEAAVAIDLAKSGLIVIDADRHGDADGVTAIAELMHANGFDPNPVPTVATPNQGTHWYFRQRQGEALGNNRGSLPAGIDVRGAGGFVLAPGTHMADGRLYEGFGAVAEAPVLPDWLVTLIAAKPVPVPVPVPSSPLIADDRARAYVDAAVSAEIEAVRTAPRGTRNQQLNRSAFALGQFVGGQLLGEQEAAALLENAASDLTRDDGAPQTRKTIRSGLIAGRREPRQLPIEEAGVVTEADYAVSAQILAAFEGRGVPAQIIEHEDGTLTDPDGVVVEPSQPSVYTELEYPPGLVGDIASWIVATSRRPQPNLAIGAALTIVGTMAGRQFRGPTQSATHLYVLALAPTGKGKDAPLTQISRIMNAAKLSNHLGPSEFISMPAVINFLARKPLAVCAMDEFGAFLKRITNRRASGFEGAITKILRTLWGASFAPYTTPEWAGRQCVTLFTPALSIFGASTPREFYGALEGASVDDGTLNRFLIVTGRGDVDDREPLADPSQVPLELVDDLRSIYFRSGELSVAYRNDPSIDPAGEHGKLVNQAWAQDGAEKRRKALVKEIERLGRKDPELEPYYARTAEMAVRVASIVAIGRRSDTVTLDDLEYGIGVAMLSAETMVSGAADYMSDNENQANAQKIMRIIKARGGLVRHNALVRAMQHTMKSRELKDVLALLAEAGQIESGKATPPGGGTTTTYYKAL